MTLLTFTDKQSQRQTNTAENNTILATLFSDEIVRFTFLMSSLHSTVV